MDTGRVTPPRLSRGVGEVIDAERLEELSAAGFHEHVPVGKEDRRNCGVTAVDREDRRNGLGVAVDVDLFILDAGSIQHGLRHPAIAARRGGVDLPPLAGHLVQTSVMNGTWYRGSPSARVRGRSR